MDINSLSAVSPLDGRYKEKCKELSAYFSEGALMRYRVMIEIEYFIALCKIPLPQLKSFNKKNYPSLKKIYLDFDDREALKIKKIEASTNHDVKAVEYYIKAKFDELHLNEYKEYIHFALTSQDINNTAIPLSLKEYLENVYYPASHQLLNKLRQQIEEWKNIAMLSRTHGQPASPTRLGKEIAVFYERLYMQLESLKNIPHAAKFGGATGNFNAHVVAYPKIRWNKFADNFVGGLALKRSQTTTQIEHYDQIAAQFDSLKRINTILIDLCRDMWSYISINYFKQEIKKGETGSSAMPHKINPIDFENAEGNFGIANALFEHMSAKLPVSRMQRDLTDSTVLRNTGVPFGHSLIGMKSLLKGLDKIKLNKAAIDNDLEENWVVIGEAIQTILRREGYPKPYETLKELTRKNLKINKKEINDFINNLKVSSKVKKELFAITPYNYTGITT